MVFWGVGSGGVVSGVLVCAAVGFEVVVSWCMVSRGSVCRGSQREGKEFFDNPCNFFCFSLNLHIQNLQLRSNLQIFNQRI